MYILHSVSILYENIFEHSIWKKLAGHYLLSYISILYILASSGTSINSQRLEQVWATFMYKFKHLIYLHILWRVHALLCLSPFGEKKRKNGLRDTDIRVNFCSGKIISMHAGNWYSSKLLQGSVLEHSPAFSKIQNSLFWAYCSIKGRIRWHYYSPHNDYPTCI